MCIGVILLFFLNGGRTRSSYIRVASIHGVALVSFLLFNVRWDLGCVIHGGELSCMERFSAALNLGYSISSVKRKETNATVGIDVPPSLC